jgi:hypothetical protein
LHGIFNFENARFQLKMVSRPGTGNCKLEVGDVRWKDTRGLASTLSELMGLARFTQRSRSFVAATLG